MKRLPRAIPARAWVLLVALLLLAGLAALYQASRKPGAAIVLLVPDEAALARPVTRAWLDAAKEEGLSVVTMTDDAFLRYGGDGRGISGVILPDTVHPQASELLVNQLHRYVQAGGHLFITFDAALLNTQDGRYAADQSRLSRLAGVPYAMRGAQNDRPTDDPERPGQRHFRTGSAQGAIVLLFSERGDTIVSQHGYGQGTVLFANLPLGYLKTRADPYPLHRLLSHFASHLPRAPDALRDRPATASARALSLVHDGGAAR